MSVVLGILFKNVVPYSKIKSFSFVFLPANGMNWNPWSLSEQFLEDTFSPTKDKLPWEVSSLVFKPRGVRGLHFRLWPLIPHKPLLCCAVMKCSAGGEFSKAWGNGWYCKIYCHIKLAIIKYHVSQGYDKGNCKVFL